VTNICPAPANDNISQTENSKDDSTDESNDRPMNLAAKPEVLLMN
jgi:hypothetical protein